MRNALFIGRDNELVLKVTFQDEFATLGLANFDRIEFSVGGETYSSLTDPDKIVIDGDFIRVRIGDVTAIPPGLYDAEVIGYSAAYDDGFVLACNGVTGLPPLQAVQC